MRIISEASRETNLLVELFCGLSLGQQVSFDEAETLLGFKVKGSPSYYSARRIVLNRHNVVIEGVRGFGFARLNGEAMIGAHCDRRQRNGRRQFSWGRKAIEVAFATSNLSETAARDASDKYNRFGLILDISRPARTNRRLYEMPASEPLVSAGEMWRKYEERQKGEPID